MCFLCLSVANQVIGSPRIECDAPKFDFGTVIGLDEIVYEFTLWNRGDEPIKISSIKNCCGTQSTITPMEILPGSTAVCKSVFATRNRYGQQDKQILIASNDPRHPYFELKMTGTLLRPVEVSPRLVRLGDLLPASVISETVTATNLLETAVGLESVSTTIKGMKAEVVEIRDPGSRLQDDTRSWTILLRSSGALPVGKLSGQLQLNFSSGMVNVPVIGTVRPVIQAVPDRIQLSANSINAIERLVMLRSGDGRPFEILSATLENADGSVKIKKLTKGKWQCLIAIMPDAVKPNAVLRVETSGSAQLVIAIPLIKE